MGGVVLWVAGKQFLVKHVKDGVQSSPVTDPPVVPLNALVLTNLFTLFLMGRNSRLKGDSVKVAFFQSN
jgi:hypothetical protein